MEQQHFGSFLRNARQERDISLEHVAKLTKLSQTSLLAIEAGKLDDLPPEIFVRGFIRSYARALGVSDAEPIALFDQVARARAAEQQAAHEAVTPGPKVSRQALLPATWLPNTGVDDDTQVSRRGYGLAVFVVIVLLIATITLSYFMSQPPPSGEGLSLRAPTSAPGADHADRPSRTG